MAIKQKISLFLAIVFMGGSSLFGTQFVFADSTSDNMIWTIDSIYQGGVELGQYDCSYYSGMCYDILSLDDEITATITIDNMKDGLTYSLAANSFSGTYTSSDNGSTITVPIKLDKTPAFSTAWIGTSHYERGENGSQMNYVSEGNTTLVFFIPSSISSNVLPGLELSLSQNNNIISPIVSNQLNYYHVNTVEDLSVTIRTIQQVPDDSRYWVGVCFSFSPCTSEEEYSGAELNAGVVFNSGPNTMRDGQQYNVSLNYYTDQSVFRKETTGGLMVAEDDDTVPNYSTKLLYQDTSCQEALLPSNSIVSGEAVIIDDDCHNSNKPLTVRIEGERFQPNQDYVVRLEIIKSQSITAIPFLSSSTVKGNILNNGYDILIQNYNMEFPISGSSFGGVDINNYLIRVRVGTISKEWLAYYASGVELESAVFYGDGEKSILPILGAGAYTAKGSLDAISNYAFRDNNSAFLYYYGQGFEEGDEYQYKLYYGKVVDGSPGHSFEADKSSLTLVSNGSLKGKKINAGELGIRIDNNNHYERPVYILEIIKDGRTIYSVSDALKLLNGPTIASVEIKTNNKNTYMRMNKWKYLSTNKGNMDIRVRGIDYNPSLQYTATLTDYVFAVIDCNNASSYSSWTTDGNGRCFAKQKNGEYSKAVSGADVNDGKVKFNIPKLENASKEIVLGRYIEAKIEGHDSIDQIGWFDIEYVEDKDLFPDNFAYSIDSTSDAIKKIRKRTSKSDFVSNATILNNGTIKVYDKDGINEQTGIVGTGMIARLIDENNRPIIDMDIIVVGDVNGDGDITPTDLAKERRHLAGTEELEGPYRRGGSANGDEEIKLTDLFKMRQDVAGIKEME